jgi:hypothetical protein
VISRKQNEAGVLDLSNHLGFPGAHMLEDPGRALARLAREIHQEKLAVPPQGAPDRSEHLPGAVEMVVDVAGEREIDRSRRQPDARLRSHHTDDVAALLPRRALGDEAAELLEDLFGVDAPLRADRITQHHAEQAGPRAHVGHGHAGLGGCELHDEVALPIDLAVVTFEELPPAFGGHARIVVGVVRSHAPRHAAAANNRERDDSDHGESLGRTAGTHHHDVLACERRAR